MGDLTLDNNHKRNSHTSHRKRGQAGEKKKKEKKGVHLSFLVLHSLYTPTAPPTSSPSLLRKKEKEKTPFFLSFYSSLLSFGRFLPFVLRREKR